MTLQAFLRPVATEESREVVISSRFVDEDGKPVPFAVRAISQAENDQLIRNATKQRKQPNGQFIERLDRTEYQNRLVCACTVTPDFQSEDMLAAYGAQSPLDVPGKMLLPGEFAKLVSEIMDINKFSDNDDLAEQAKN